MEKTYNDFKWSTYQESKSILSLMNTRFWLDIIGSMGYNILNNRFETENSLFDWNISIIDYQQDVIDHFWLKWFYTSNSSKKNNRKQ